MIFSNFKKLGIYDCRHFVIDLCKLLDVENLNDIEELLFKPSKESVNKFKIYHTFKNDCLVVCKTPGEYHVGYSKDNSIFHLTSKGFKKERENLVKPFFKSMRFLCKN